MIYVADKAVLEIVTNWYKFRSIIKKKNDPWTKKSPI